MIKTLVVDNDPVLLKAVSEILKRLGCAVRTADNGLNGLEMLEEEQPDILFTDLIMPNVGGEKICKIVRSDAKYNSVFLVVLTAIDQENQVELSKKIPFDICIAKGLLHELRENLKEALSIYEQRKNSNTVSQETALIGDTDNTQSIATELLHAREHLFRLIENMNEGVIELTQEGKLSLQTLQR